MTSSTTSTRTRLVQAAAAFLLGVVASACADKSKHATDGDTTGSRAKGAKPAKP